MAKVTGGDGYTRKLRSMPREIVRELGGALFAAGEMVQVDAQNSITAGSQSGRNHVPSAPGEPPNNDSGVLAGNIETAQLAPLIVEVSSNASYAVALEYGTSKMIERPYMRPALERNREKINALINEAVDRAIKKAG